MTEIHYPRFRSRVKLRNLGLFTYRIITRYINSDIAKLYCVYPSCQSLDAGESHLFAFLYTHNICPNPAILIATADKAAIRAVGELRWLDSMVPLEQLLCRSGVTKKQLGDLKLQYRTHWLDEVKISLKLNQI